jgi:hypothetical protein
VVVKGPVAVLWQHVLHAVLHAGCAPHDAQNRDGGLHKRFIQSVMRGATRHLPYRPRYVLCRRGGA